MTIRSTRPGRDHGTGPTPAGRAGPAPISRRATDTPGTTGVRRGGGASGALRALGHRWPTLLAVAVVVATFGDGVPPREVLAGLLAVMVPCYLVFGVVRGELRRPSGVLALQLTGLAGFTAVSAAALAVDGTLGLYVVAAGWLAHGVWDFAHHRTGRVVPRAWSEWCCVVDVLGAVAIVLLA
ncbi:hypothetical protein ACF068_10605 [Streptomyces sp. NPDC016309]|uniref:hypothetical protein n=1 Tax=Streptomyces sp. NPDC016309 TaxID=3364965 RepID=UPI00370341AE